MQMPAFQALRGRLKKNESLAEYNAWRVGGLADIVYIPADVSDLIHFLQQLPQEIPIFWLGLGSNVLIRDGGLEGAVIITQGALIHIEKLDNFHVRAEAGVACAQIARFTARLGLTGLEFMAGIPGTVGGALAMNAGCYGGETWNYVTEVETIDRKGNKRIRQPREYQIGYRQVLAAHEEWFLAGNFKLTAGDKTQSLANIRQLLEKRNHSQPTGLPNCGSVFKNPEGNFAARLIEQCGLKGSAMGGAKVSDKHANFIINDKSATASDIEALIKKVKETVLQRHGVHLIPEVCIIGRTTSGVQG